jgi:hypothetical protein
MKFRHLHELNLLFFVITSFTCLEAQTIDISLGAIQKFYFNEVPYIDNNGHLLTTFQEGNSLLINGLYGVTPDGFDDAENARFNVALTSFRYEPMNDNIQSNPNQVPMPGTHKGYDVHTG